LPRRVLALEVAWSLVAVAPWVSLVLGVDCAAALEVSLLGFCALGVDWALLLMSLEVLPG